MSHRTLFKLSPIAAAMLALVPAVSGAASVVTTPSSNLPVGRVAAITVSASTVTGCNKATSAFRYRIEVKKDGKQVFFRDWHPSATAQWVPMAEGSYAIAANVTCFVEGPAHYEGSELTSGAVKAVARDLSMPRADVSSADAALFDMDNPLVKLVEAKTCPAGAGTTGIRVEFEPDDPATTPFSDPSRMTRTPAQRCDLARPYFLLAGMRPSAAYRARLTTAADGSPYGTTLAFQSDALPATFPVFHPSRTGYRSAKDTLLMSAIIQVPGVDDSPQALPVATDLDGDPIWFYGTELTKKIRCLSAQWAGTAGCQSGGAQYPASVTATTLGDGRLLLVTGDTKDHDGQYLREVDLAGNLLRELSIEHLRVQLEGKLQAAGWPELRIGAFDHEAIRLVNGHLVAQITAEAPLKPTPSAQAINTLGNLLVDLDDTGTVRWYWNSFAEAGLKMDPKPADVCGAGIPGCPPLFNGTVAYDRTHGNAIAYSPADGNLIHSMRNQDAVVKLDYRCLPPDVDPQSCQLTTGKILWTLGDGGDTDDTVGELDPKWFTHQHGVSYLTQEGTGAGRIILFDNGNTRCDESGAADCHSRGQTWDLRETLAPGATTLESATPVLNLDLGAYSQALGMAQQLAEDRWQFTLGMPKAECDGSEGQPEQCGDRTSGEVTYGKSVEVNGRGRDLYSQWVEGSLYRSYRMADLYTAGPSASGRGVAQ